jgi:hypothetical protein
MMNKILKGAVIAVVVALLTYAEDTVPGISFGTWTPMAVAFNSALVNAVREFLKLRGYTA